MFEQLENYDQMDQEEVTFNPRIEYDCSNIPSGKLERFINGNNTYKRFDKEFASYHVAQAYFWYDPLHLYAEHNGFKNESKKIKRMIEKLSKGGVLIDHLIHKMVNSVQYKKCDIYKSAADLYIEALNDKQDWRWRFMLDEYENVDGVLYRKNEMLKYLGYGYKELKYTMNGKTFYRYEELDHD